MVKANFVIKPCRVGNTATGYDCDNPCLTVSLPKMRKGPKWLPQCQTIPELNCMRWKIYDSLMMAFDSCKRLCTRLEFKGSLLFSHHLKTDQRLSWSNFILKSVAVHEEHLVLHFPELIGSIGGTMGLFIGFSFQNFIFAILNYLKNFITRKIN